MLEHFVTVSIKPKHLKLYPKPLCSIRLDAKHRSCRSKLHSELGKLPLNSHKLAWGQ